MEQLSGMDSAFLYLETPRTPMHIGAIAIYDPSTAPNSFVRFKDILNFIESRLHLAKSFRRKLANVPLNLDFPYWVDDPDFDLEYHVRHIALPQPGDWRQLCIQAARLHSRPVDLSKPLWEFTVIEGLNNVPGVPKGSYAIVSKIHHAAIDGVSGVDIANAVHSIDPEGAIAPPDRPWIPERTPTSVELLARAQVNTIATPLRLARTIAKSAPGLAKAAMGLVRGNLHTSMGRVPRTRFNGSVTMNRVVDGRDFSLAEIKDIRLRLPGATVNDVVVAIVGGAMRKYLKGKSELPRESLVCMAPISVRTPGEKNALGNQVSAMTIPIGTHIADPFGRLQFVHEEAQASKALTNAAGARQMTEYAQFMPSTLSGLAARLYVRLGLANRIAPMFNTVITNIPGPPIPLYMNGARLVTQFGLGPVFEGMGIIHPVFSYCGRITIAFTSDRSIIPDPETYAGFLQESFEEIKAAALKKPIPAPKVEPVPVAAVADMPAPTKKSRPRKRKPKLTVVSAAE
ncbi:MAG: wax ester/triacylglycerol synthase family O-acyltransferase [Alphaproteobacteria bacterium]|nr:wax ester/triacylglycerol synthase family O-acyltransferase [Alphaproteobacteria bacterium]